MNEIQQKRIEEAAKTSITETLMSTPNYEFSPKATDMLECAYIKGAEDILNNQWISVEEGLPKEFKKVFIKLVGKNNSIGYGNGYVVKEDWYTDVEQVERDYFKFKITHWMPIPSSEGGKE